MKIHIDIPKRDRVTLKRIRAVLVKYRNVSGDVTRAQKDYEASVARLEREIARLEGAENLTDNIVRRLAFAREKLRQHAQRPPPRAEVPDADMRSAYAAVDTFNPIFRRVLRQIQHQMEQNMIEALRPFYREDRLHPTMIVITDSDAMRSFGNFVSGFSVVIPDADLIKIIDIVLKGESPWQWPPA